MPVKKLTIKILCLLVLISTHSLAQAKLVESLYSAQTLVTDQSKAARISAIEQLFKSVLIKVSGHSAVIDNPDIAKEISESMSYITTFNYQMVEGRRHLVASFNESSIDTLLKQAGVSIWGDQRPTAMIWLAFRDNDDQRSVVAGDDVSGQASVLKFAAKKRGMPMLLPLWDLEDQFSISAGEVWGMFPDSVGLANSRYATDFMVLSRIVLQGLTYQLNWAIYKRDPSGYNAIVASGLDEFLDRNIALSALVDQTSDFFARQYSVDTSALGGEQEFIVANVDSVANYAAVLKYLNGLKGLESVRLKHNQHHVFSFVATVIGNHQSLEEVLKLERKLVESYDDALGLEVYQWQGAN